MPWDGGVTNTFRYRIRSIGLFLLLFYSLSDVSP